MTTETAPVHVWLEHIVDVDTGGKAIMQTRCILCAALPDSTDAAPAGYDCDVNQAPEFDFQEDGPE